MKCKSLIATKMAVHLFIYNVIVCFDESVHIVKTLFHCSTNGNESCVELLIDTLGDSIVNQEDLKGR